MGDRWFVGSMVVRWGWVPVLMVADWGRFSLIIDLGFLFFSLLQCCGWWLIRVGFHYSLILDFFSSRCCSAVGGGCCGDVNGCVLGFQRWILVATVVMVFFSPLLPDLDLVQLVVVCACIWWWLVVADFCLHFQVFKSKPLKMFY